jgi:hypothetical protein
MTTDSIGESDSRMLPMKLLQFRVTNFRSVSDSGWVEADNVAALIGVNESGKTNLLLPLWKLKPASDGEIQPTSDYPKTMFGKIRAAPGDYYFIEADFATGATARSIAAAARISEDAASVVRVTRCFDGNYRVEFPEHEQRRSISKQWLAEKIEACARSIEGGQALKQEADLQAQLSNGLRQAAAELPDEEAMEKEAIAAAKGAVEALIPEDPAKTSAIVPLVKKLSDEIGAELGIVSALEPGEREGVIEAVIAAIPSFVYYSNYGNLDSEIYLPHVVENLKREDLGAKEATKARTLRVLFSFVKLEAKEILNLGRDFKDINGQNREPDDDEIAEIAKEKRTRSILLQSASANLTTKFRDWWKQGDHQFRFEADGNHFRIWVKDDRRPTEVELENRSAGLQWFLSFYLVFLVESLGQHRRSILLLDEPGMPSIRLPRGTFLHSLRASPTRTKSSIHRIPRSWSMRTGLSGQERSMWRPMALPRPHPT